MRKHEETKLPLLEHEPERPTAFSAENLVAAVREERGSGAGGLPPVCVMEFDGDLTDWLVDTGKVRRWDAWACFHTEMQGLEVDGETCGIIPRTIGGPYTVLIAEQLRASGAGVILGLTSSGRVLPAVPVPSLVVATSAIRDEGTSYHYLPPAPRVEAPPVLPGLLAEEVAATGLPVSRGLVWTTDAPYRETREQLARHAAEGALAVEMQAASLFAFAAARGAAVGLVAHVTNAVDHAGEDFDKGTQEDGLRLLEAICRAGLRFMRERPRKSIVSPRLA